MFSLLHENRGQFSINVKGKDSGCYKDEGFFGELAMMYNTPRAATITAATDGVLWAIDRICFNKIVLRVCLFCLNNYDNYYLSTT